MPSNTSSNRMAQYAIHSSLDAGIRDVDANQARARLDEQRPATPPSYGFPTRQAVTESAKLPAPKPFAPGRDQFDIIRHLGQPNPPHPLRMQSPSSVRDAPPQRQRLRRTNSQGTDVTTFWPESQIDSQFGSPTTQRSERYDAAVDGRRHSPPPAFKFPSLQPLPTGNMGNGGRVSYTIGKNGAMRASSSNDELGLPNSINALPPPLEPANQTDGYSSEPFHSPPKRRVNLALHSTTVKNPYVPPLYDDDQEVFSDPPIFQMPNDKMRGSKKQAKFQEHRRNAGFQDDEEVEGSLASDYQISEDDNGTPRASRKQVLSQEPAILETSIPAPVRKPRDKTRKRRRDSCDYADDELAGMAYTQLRDQPFDDDPAQKSTKAIGPLTGDSLLAKLEHFKGQCDAEQKQFFMQMTVDEWERSGDWLLEQFGQVAQKLKDARQNKRTMVEQFESEIAKREEAVRLRTESINKKLSQIKHKGEDMLADKEL